MRDKYILLWYPYIFVLWIWLCLHQQALMATSVEQWMVSCQGGLQGRRQAWSTPQGLHESLTWNWWILSKAMGVSTWLPRWHVPKPAGFYNSTGWYFAALAWTSVFSHWRSSWRNQSCQKWGICRLLAHLYFWYCLFFSCLLWRNSGIQEWCMFNK